jgi:hypothetical protein
MENSNSFLDLNSELIRQKSFPPYLNAIEQNQKAELKSKF